MVQAFGLYISYTLGVPAKTIPTYPMINADRLMQKIMDLASIGPIEGGGCARLALTDEDAAGRDLVVAWMNDLGLRVTTDVIGNVVGTWEIGKGLPVMTGSHIDTVRTGGKYDGNLGVLAGLEVIQTLQENGFEPERPISVGIFTNEEGSRFAPDMLGSLVYVGGLAVEEALDIVGIDGARVGDELERIGYNGATPCPGFAPHSFVELHIEQGPVLERTNMIIGAVTSVQGISWQEITVLGQSNHAGTTPMNMRKDPGYVAAAIAVFLRDLASKYGGHQVCTVGKIDLFPNLINVIPAKAVVTVDIRNTDEKTLRQAEKEFADFLVDITRSEGVTVSTRYLARFEPVEFHPQVVELISTIAKTHTQAVVHMPSGAGHDAQMFARVCPSAMIFVPSVEGISHNASEYTSPEDITLGTNILLQVLLQLAAIREFSQ
jgi:beta-ureidopropionase / N-carbamoyl-L-amino-acid hydrolase